ncbi:hypothetical protein Bca52824_044597 [Brassica carinata]|uniref:Uncharacterized protein n=1 Tax=Brassica carinata TaxID=52824 RepID=A0A8X7R940_BRACI|nr:hypothetical protein Bca52824_044597 [Brassica carinata]
MDVYGLSSQDLLRVDDLLDFSNEDIFSASSSTSTAAPSSSSFLLRTLTTTIISLPPPIILSSTTSAFPYALSNDPILKMIFDFLDFLGFDIFFSCVE